MGTQRGTLHTIARHLVLALEPLKAAVAGLPAFRTLLYQLGWEVKSLPPEYAALAPKVDQALAALDALGDDPAPAEILAALDKVKALYTALTGITTAPDGVDAAEFLSEIGQALFDLLLTDYLNEALPGLYSALLALDIIAQRYVEETDARPSFFSTRIQWGEIPKILRDPGSIPARIYGWGTDELDGHRLAGHLLEFFLALNWPAYIGPVDEEVGRGFKDSPDDPTTSIDWALKLPVLTGNIGGSEIEVGVALLELPAQNGRPAGLILQPLAPPEIGTRHDISDSLRIELRGEGDVANMFGVLLRPDDISVKFPLQQGAALPSAGFGFALTYEGAEPFRLFGNPDGIRLEGKAAKFLFDLNLKQGELELKLAAAPEDLTLVLNADDLDGFLGSILGGREARVAFPLALAWSNRTGLNFLAGLGFEISAYPHLDLGLLRFDRVDLGVRLTAGASEPPQLDLRVASALSGSLGPISYSVDGLGVHLPITFEPGNAGPFDIDFGMVWPIGIGLAVDAGALTGGGFIKRDPDGGSYCGMLELRMFDIGVAAIGILDTRDAMGARLPPPGYSFFMSVSAEFSPIQLGDGFTLNGLGGIAGVHRRMDVDAILSGLREGALDAVMFPKDLVANSAVIVSNLTTIFPIAMNRYVFGPMAIIGWGTPTLVTIELAVLLEVPSPIVLALLGKVRIAIPTEDEPVIAINLDFIGVLDYGRSLLAVDAVLRDSHIAAFAIAGDMAMRLSWAGKRSLAMAIGGLHPHFTAPPGFPALRRVTVALGSGDNPRITLECYFALTSNSRQFGAKAELYAKAGSFSVRGWLGFDALFTVRPLWFRIDFEAGMTLNRGSRRIAGITVRGSLTGPSPLHVWGEGCISILFFDVCVPFEKTFGLERIFDLPARDPWAVLEAAIRNVENWAGELGRGVAPGATIRTNPTGAVRLLLNPMGAATLRQRALPFNRRLERFGEFEIAGPDRFDVADVKLGGDATSGWTIADEDFVPGDFEALSETDRLSRDSFESMAAGVTVGAGLVAAPQEALKLARLNYETRIIDAPWNSRVQPGFDLSRALQLAARLRGAKASYGLARSGRDKFAGDYRRAPGVAMRSEAYAIADVGTLAARADLAAGTTRGAAYLAVRDRFGRGANAGAVQVVPTHELEFAA